MRLLKTLLYHTKHLLKATAQQVAQLLNRISLTTVQADKARCIELMRDLQVQYPEIETQLHHQVAN